MIKNIETFEECLGDLLSFYNKPLSNRVKQWWLAAVDAELSDEEFEQACSECLRRERYLPPINEFIDLIKPSRAALQAYQDGGIWQGIVYHSKRVANPAIATQHKKSRQHFLERLDHDARYALENLGGLRSLCQVAESDLHWREKDFFRYLELYRKQAEMGNVPALGELGASTSASAGDLPESRSQPVEFENSKQPERVVSDRRDRNGEFSSLRDLL